MAPRAVIAAKLARCLDARPRQLNLPSWDTLGQVISILGLWLQPLLRLHWTDLDNELTPGHRDDAAAGLGHEGKQLLHPGRKRGLGGSGTRSGSHHREYYYYYYYSTTLLLLL